jgi:O-antigen/teichoic acid export membrane protein
MGTVKSQAPRLMVGSAMRLISRFVSLGVAFFLVPFTLKHLGEHGYGIWALASTFLGYYGLADFGIGSAVSRYVSQAIGAGNKAEFRRTFSTSFFMLLAVGGCVFLISQVVAASVARATDDPAQARVYYLVVSILGLNLAFQSPLRAFNGLLTSHLRYDILSGAQIGQTVVRAVLIVVFLNAGYGLVALVAISAAMDTANGIARAAMCFFVHDGLRLSTRDVSLGRAVTLARYGVFTVVSQVADLLRLRTGPFVITAVHGAAMVAPYAVAMRLQEMAEKLLFAVIAVLAPVFSRQDGSGDLEAMRRLYLFASRLSTYAAVFLGGLLVVLGKPFLSAWLGSTPVDVGAVFPILAVLAVAGAASGAQNPTVGLLYGTSRNDLYAGINTAHGLISLAVSLALVRPFGLMGVALGMALPTLVFKMIVQPLYVCRILKIGVAEFFAKHAALDWSVALLFVAVFGIVSRPLLRPNFVSVAALSLAASILFAPYAVFVGLDSMQRSSVAESLRVIAGRRARR